MLSVRLLCGDSLVLMAGMPEASIDLVFADPPYFLSNGGTTCHRGRRRLVDKGSWDRGSAVANHEWTRSWLTEARRVMKPSATIWITGTMHSIPSVGFALQELEFRMLNSITWEKPNPPPNLGCRTFTHSTETVLWASRGKGAKHHFAYSDMRELNGGKQMKDVWRMFAPGKAEKMHGKHPTQKPVALLERIIQASCPPGGRMLDPFMGSGTSAVAATASNIDYIGIDSDPGCVSLAIKRTTHA